jgi:hypothetical protein
MSCLLNTSSTHLVSLSTAIIFCALATYGIVFRNGHFVNTVEPVYDGRFPRIKRKWYQSLMLSNPVAGLVTRGYRSVSSGHWETKFTVLTAPRSPRSPRNHFKSPIGANLICFYPQSKSIWSTYAERRGTT